MTDLKSVYKASTKSLAEQELAALETKWGKKYPTVIKSGLAHGGTNGVTHRDYTVPIRKQILTIYTIEGYHRQLRKVTKNKGAFPNDMALLGAGIPPLPGE